MSKIMDLPQAVKRGYLLACRPQGVTRAQLTSELDSQIGWKRYLERMAKSDARRLLKPKKSDDGSVLYRVVGHKAAASRVGVMRKVAR